MVIRVENLVFMILNTLLLFFGLYCVFFSYNIEFDNFLENGWFLSGIPVKLIGLFSLFVSFFLYKKEFMRIIRNKKRRAR